MTPLDRGDTAFMLICSAGVGGIVGAPAAGVFATVSMNTSGPKGLISGNPALLGIQAIAVLAKVA